MLASRSLKPKLSLSISTPTSASSSRPALKLSLASPTIRSPISPSPISPTARNTRLNQRGYSTLQQASYSYANYSQRPSILKKTSSDSYGSSSSSRYSSGGSLAAPSSSGKVRREIKFRDEPIVHSITPVGEEDEAAYYGPPVKMSREERRWSRR
jgi:hypothetical protein